MLGFEQVSTMTLAASDGPGQPHAAPVYFVALEIDADQAMLNWRLYFFSDPDSQHARYLAYKPRAAVALYPECQDWRDIRGLQMHGQIHQVEPGLEWEQAWDAYRAKFPFVAQLKPIVARNSLYVFVPDWIRLVDNRQGFGYKKEWGAPGA
jgi:uncharacterized protein YhbP (UPF0306 family)